MTACGGAGERPATPKGAVSIAAHAEARELSDADVERVVKGVSAARQLEPTRPVSIVRLDKKAFVARLLGEPSAPSPSASTSLSSDAAFLVGFDFLPPPAKRSQIATMDQVLEEQVAGFYELATDKVFLPNVALKSDEDLFEQRAVLAHEVHHALQAQHFPKLDKPASSDESTARLALIEGDAMVAMGALLGSEAGAPVGRTLRRIVDVTKRVPLATVTRGEASKQLDRALDIARRRLEFPYVDGMLFVADVYRAGGFPLVDAMYKSPPRSTEQVLHPEKYLAGEMPRPAADPKPPRGYTLATTDTLGELDTTTLLARCMDPKVAEAAAAGWAGDRFSVFVAPDRSLAVAWVSAWDSEQDASEFEAALQKGEACWHDNALGAKERDYVIGAAHQVRRQGKLVAFLRGVPAALQDGLMKSLFGLVGPEPAAKPLTELKIPPRVKLPEPARGRLSGDVYQNDWLSLVGRVPQGMLVEMGDGLELSVHRTDVLVRGGLAVSTRITSDEENEKTFREVQESFVAEVGKMNGRVFALGGGPVQTALGNGIERTWRVAATSIELRLVLIPVCAGTGSVVFVQAYGDPYARYVLDGWMGSFRWMHGRNLTACDFLDPK